MANITAAALDLSPADILGPDRRRQSAHARAIAMYLAHVGLGMSLAQVGRGFGRHHSTVAHACRVVEEMRDDSAQDGRLDFLEFTACWAAYGWGLGR
ncbi:helix-turn-helix domain-containing protein [Ancylobacter terrae]|uniref:helix-turn-helix domain-containing protein n=1 Tax=Ancylobacter sp. sgz301288 TaxID=3342077 RepID=UPI00385C154F